MWTEITINRPVATEVTIYIRNESGEIEVIKKPIKNENTN